MSRLSPDATYRSISAGESDAIVTSEQSNLGAHGGADRQRDPGVHAVGSAGQALEHAPRVVVVARLAKYLVVYRDHRVGAEHSRGGVSGSDGVRLGTGQANDVRGRGLARSGRSRRDGRNQDRLKSGRPE